MNLPEALGAFAYSVWTFGSGNVWEASPRNLRVPQNSVHKELLGS